MGGVVELLRSIGLVIVVVGGASHGSFYRGVEKEIFLHILLWHDEYHAR